MTGPRPRPELSDLTPYHSSETARGRVFLHANENPYDLPPAVREEVDAALRALNLNRYPDPHNTELRETIAEYAGVDPSWVWIGDGSNEVLLQACLAYGGPGRRALIFEPTYRMHHRQARMAGTEVEIVRRKPSYEIDVYDALEAIEARQPDILFLCTPNNPTGTVTPPADLAQLVEAAPGLVLIDEAYYEFVRETFVPRLGEFGNVLVVRTLSKAFRFASARLGYGIAPPALLDELARVRMPYAQSAFTQTAAAIVVRRRDQLLDVVPTLISERDRLFEGLASIDGVEPFPSGANFVLFRATDPAQVMAALAAQGIVIRDFTSLEGCENCLRVSVGTPEENTEFLQVMASSYL